MTEAGLTSLSVVAPAYNEAAGLHDLVVGWHACLSGFPDLKAFEMVICNDGSTDNTGEILDALHARYPEVRVLHFKHNQGAASAMSHAIANSRYAWVLVMDSDGQFPIENVQILADCAQKSGAKAVIGARCKNDSPYKRFGSKLSGFVCNLVHGTRLQDFNSAMKLVDGALIRKLVLEARGMNYSAEMTSRLIETGVPLVEVPVIHHARIHGSSRMRLVRDTWHRALFVAYLVFRNRLQKMGVLRTLHDA